MRQRKNFTRREGDKSARLVVIAAEGRETENIYFEAMKVSLCASKVHVEVLHRDSDQSSPEHVFDQIHQFMSEYNIEEDDQLWVVVDKDRWKVKMLAEIASYYAQNKNLACCVSNPCMEKTNGKTWLKQRMKDLTEHYQESSYDAMALLQHVQSAIERAERLDVKPNDRWPQKVGTRVYRLAKSIIDKT